MIELDVITAPVVLPDFSEITKTHAELALKADAIIIRNVEEQGNALEFLRDLRKNLKLARAKFKLIKDPMNAAKDHEPEPIVIPDVPLMVAPVQTASVAGIQSRVNYSCEVTDLKALAEYCLSRPDLLALYIQPNAVALGQLARQRKENFILPGCKLITKYV